MAVFKVQPIACQQKLKRLLPKPNFPGTRRATPRARAKTIRSSSLTSPEILCEFPATVKGTHVFSLENAFLAINTLYSSIVNFVKTHLDIRYNSYWDSVVFLPNGAVCQHDCGGFSRRRRRSSRRRRFRSWLRCCAGLIPCIHWRSCRHSRKRYKSMTIQPKTIQNLTKNCQHFNKNLPGCK